MPSETNQRHQDDKQKRLRKDSSKVSFRLGKTVVRNGADQSQRDSVETACSEFV